MSRFSFSSSFSLPTVSMIWKCSLLYVILPNIAFVALSAFVDTPRAYLNLDYCLIGLLSPFLLPVFLLLLYMALLVCDIYTAFAPSYHFSSIGLMSCYHEILELRPLYLLSLTLLCILLIVFSYFIVKADTELIDSPLIRFVTVTILAGLIFASDIANGTNSFVRFTDNVVFNTNIAGSGVYRLALDLRSFTNDHKEKPRVLPIGSYATSFLDRDLKVDPHFSENVVLVLVESWGVSTDEGLNKSIMAPLTNRAVESRYEINRGEIPFGGSTVPAELRELGGMFTHYPEKLGNATLPMRLAAKGYESTAVHGFTGTFFGRDQWYPQLGFAKTFFKRDLDQQLPGHADCGVMLRGVCDDEIPEFIDRILLAKDGKSKFVYWLTLNSHYPFSFPEKGSSFKTKATIAARYPDVLNISATIYNTFDALSRMICNSNLPPTRFIITGDHSPPLLLHSENGLYNGAHVPFIELIPRKLAEPKR